MPFKVPVHEKATKENVSFTKRKKPPSCAHVMVISALQGLRVSYLLNSSCWNRSTD